MRTLVVGDLHLLGSIILPLVEEKAKQEKVERIVLLGDYFDQWGQTANVNLYKEELNFLKVWVQAQRSKKIEVICLLGNHDVPYLTGNLSYYSMQDAAMIQEIKATLLLLGVQIAAKVDEFLISHAGFLADEKPKEWYFTAVDSSHLAELNQLEKMVGKARGGSNEIGSVFWADYHFELALFYNRNYPKQIVGHTPVTKITRNKAAGYLFGVDTFSLTSDYYPIGNGALLLLEDGQVKGIATKFSTILLNKNLANTLFCLED